MTFGPYNDSAAGSGIATTDAYAAVAGSIFDSEGLTTTSVAYRVAETGGANGITVKLQASMDGSDWEDFTVYDEAGSERTSVDVALAASASAYLILTATLDNGVKIAFRHFRLAVKSTTGGSAGTLAFQALTK